MHDVNWTNLENIMLNKRRQWQNVTYMKGPEQANPLRQKID